MEGIQTQEERRKELEDEVIEVVLRKIIEKFHPSSASKAIDKKKWKKAEKKNFEDICKNNFKAFDQNFSDKFHTVYEQTKISNLFFSFIEAMDVVHFQSKNRLQGLEQFCEEEVFLEQMLKSLEKVEQFIDKTE